MVAKGIWGRVCLSYLLGLLVMRCQDKKWGFTPLVPVCLWVLWKHRQKCHWASAKPYEDTGTEPIHLHAKMWPQIGSAFQGSTELAAQQERWSRTVSHSPGVVCEAQILDTPSPPSKQKTQLSGLGSWQSTFMEVGWPPAFKCCWWRNVAVSWDQALTWNKLKALMCHGRRPKIMSVFKSKRCLW